MIFQGPIKFYEIKLMGVIANFLNNLSLEYSFPLEKSAKKVGLGFLAGQMWPAGIAKARTLGGCSYQESSVFT